MKKTRQILAWIGIVLLIALYVSAMVLAFMGGEHARNMLGAAIFCTFVVPIMIWVYTFLYKVVKGKKENNDEF